jgi:hypothetical protein
MTAVIQIGPASPTISMCAVVPMSGACGLHPPASLPLADSSVCGCKPANAHLVCTRPRRYRQRIATPAGANHATQARAHAADRSPVPICITAVIQIRLASPMPPPTVDGGSAEPHSHAASCAPSCRCRCGFLGACRRANPPDWPYFRSLSWQLGRVCAAGVSCRGCGCQSSRNRPCQRRRLRSCRRRPVPPAFVRSVPDGAREQFAGAARPHDRAAG